MKDVRDAFGEWIGSYSPGEISFASTMTRDNGIPFSVSAGFYGGFYKGIEAADEEHQALREAAKYALQWLQKDIEVQEILDIQQPSNQHERIEKKYGKKVADFLLVMREQQEVAINELSKAINAEHVG